MNYYNPYFYSIPTTLSTPKVGLLAKLFGNTGITLGNILNGTQRALNFANQAIPLVKQVRPMIGNAKTMFKVMNEFKRAEKPKKSSNIINDTNEIPTEEKTINQQIIDNQVENKVQDNYYYNSDNNGPTFFM